MIILQVIRGSNNILSKFLQLRSVTRKFRKTQRKIFTMAKGYSELNLISEMKVLQRLLTTSSR